MNYSISSITPRYSARGAVLGFEAIVTHNGLKKSKVVKASEPAMVRALAETQAAEWEINWSERDKKAAFRSLVADNQAEAKERTQEAEARIAELTLLIEKTLGIDDTVQWESVKNQADYDIAKPRKPNKPEKPKLTDIGPEPSAEDQRYKPNIGFFDKIFGFDKKKIAKADAALLHAKTVWGGENAKAQAAYFSEISRYQTVCDEIERAHDVAVKQWEEDRQAYITVREKYNCEVDALKQRYESSEPVAIANYNELVLSSSEYPECFPKEFDLEYRPETKTLLIDYRLPYISDLPVLKEVKYVQSRQEFQEKNLSQSDLNKIYDEVIYQTTLRTIHEVFEADSINALDAVVFNGLVRFIDSSSGHETSAFIVSLQTTKEEFFGVNLSQVEAKACFKNLKGVGSAKLHGISPIAPIMNMQREDSRFVDAHGVASGMDDSTNLASMDWQEFEHLIREIFEKEFSVNGGEVKITQASRDGGVDAVAFDPDPLRGGKIVIQAKRYTNTVTVSAVRDLYGTTMNEGAIKGILVTTSDYGPDAYAFAKDKPLTLLNGANLLHLLERHGHKARINIKEARQQK